MDLNFEYSVDEFDKEIEINLKGALDASHAVGLMDEIHDLDLKAVKRIVFKAEELTFIGSAGLRVIVYTKQKAGEKTQVIMQNPNDEITSIIEMSGLEHFIHIV